jgi:hypothetical protein
MSAPLRNSHATPRGAMELFVIIPHISCDEVHSPLKTTHTLCWSVVMSDER